MRRPRISIAALMLLTALAAVDCVAVPVIFADPLVPVPGWPGSRELDRVLLRRQEITRSVLPMANLLAIVAFVGRGGYRSSGRLGFLIGGGLMLLLAGFFAATDPARADVAYLWIGLFEPYDLDIARVLDKFARPIRVLFGYAYATWLFVLPHFAVQLAFALLGRWFDARYEIRRRPRAGVHTDDENNIRDRKYQIAK